MIIIFFFKSIYQESYNYFTATQVYESKSLDLPTDSRLLSNRGEPDKIQTHQKRLIHIVQIYIIFPGLIQE